MQDTISHVRARKIIDSRGEWTIEVEVDSIGGLNGKGAAPSGKSRGMYEARDIGADNAVIAAKSLAKKMRGIRFNQKAVDSKLVQIDGTKNFSKIGGNTSIAISLAVYEALAKNKRCAFPYPLGNVLGGGAHGGELDVQEVLICPAKAKTFPECVEAITSAHHELKRALQKTGDVGVNDEGAIIAKVGLHKALSLTCKIAEENSCRVGIDFASSGMWNGKQYEYKKLGKKFGGKEYLDFLLDLIKTYNLFYAEDAFHENDFESFAKLRKKAGKQCLVCADDLTATQPERLKAAIRNNAINAAIVKPNQVGTVSLTKRFVEIAKKNGVMSVISHRSGETTDAAISIMALDWEVPMIKAGVVDIRVAKLDRLLEAWDECRKPKMNKGIKAFR